MIRGIRGVTMIGMLGVAACGGDGAGTPVDAAATDAGRDGQPVAALPDLRFKFVGAFSSYSATSFGQGGGGSEGSMTTWLSPFAASTDGTSFDL